MITLDFSFNSYSQNYMREIIYKNKKIANPSKRENDEDSTHQSELTLKGTVLVLALG